MEITQIIIQEDMMKWRTKEGITLDIKDMTNDHLLNAQKYMQRRVKALSEESVACASMCFQGEFAQYYQEQDLDRLAEEEMDAINIVRSFDVEIKARGLTNEPKK